MVSDFKECKVIGHCLNNCPEQQLPTSDVTQLPINYPANVAAARDLIPSGLSAIGCSCPHVQLDNLPKRSPYMRGVLMVAIGKSLPIARHYGT